MPRNKVLEKAKVSFNGDRNALDLSQIRSFDALAGQLNIAYCQPFVAGTKGKITRKCFTRTASVVSPAFHSITEHFDFFVVPIHAIWRYWENWKLQINDLQDTKLVDFNGLNMAPDLSLPGYVPRVDFNGIIPKTFGDYTSVTYSSDSAAAAQVGKINDALRLLDQLNLSERIGYKIGVGQTRVMNLFMLAAYQKCYFDHYRNTAYESNNPYAYNFDWCYNSVLNGLLVPDADQSTPVNVKDIYVMKELLTMRRVNYRNDYYHNIYPSLNYVSSTPQGLSFSVPSSVAQVTMSSDPNRFHVVANNNVGVSLLQSAANLTSQPQYINVQSIRAAFALDKLMRASAYAPKHVREQYKALYGVDNVEDFDMKSERLGSFQSNVILQEVTNMAQDASYDLGNLGAKGTGSGEGEKPIEFYCKYDSIVIGLHYFVPRARYDAYGLHPWNTKIGQSDFYIKAFENLGLRPFYSTNIDAERSPVVLGWTVPNFEYKILPDLNTGCFKRKFVNFVVTNPSAGVYQANVANNGQSTDPLSTFVPHTEEPLNRTSVTAEYFKVAPEDLDNIFKNQVGASRSKTRYQFFGEFRISVPIVAPMSVHGQPNSVI